MRHINDLTIEIAEKCEFGKRYKLIIEQHSGNTRKLDSKVINRKFVEDILTDSGYSFSYHAAEKFYRIHLFENMTHDAFCQFSFVPRMTDYGCVDFYVYIRKKHIYLAGTSFSILLKTLEKNENALPQRPFYNIKTLPSLLRQCIALAERYAKFSGLFF